MLDAMQMSDLCLLGALFNNTLVPIRHGGTTHGVVAFTFSRSNLPSPKWLFALLCVILLSPYCINTSVYQVCEWSVRTVRITKRIRSAAVLDLFDGGLKGSIEPFEPTRILPRWPRLLHAHGLPRSWQVRKSARARGARVCPYTANPESDYPSLASRSYNETEICCG